jgi:hypothetical protein
MTTRPLSRIRALSGKASLRAATAVLAAGAAATFLAAPASAATTSAATTKPNALNAAICGGTFAYDEVTFQIDNCPGNGSTGWSWLDVPDVGSILTAILDTGTLYLTFQDGSTANFTVGGGGTGTEDYGKKITQAKVCETWTLFRIPPIVFPKCSTTVSIG